MHEYGCLFSRVYCRYRIESFLSIALPSYPRAKGQSQHNHCSGLISLSPDVISSRLPSNAGRTRPRPWLRAHRRAGLRSQPTQSRLPSNAGRTHPRPWLRAHRRAGLRSQPTQSRLPSNAGRTRPRLPQVTPASPDTDTSPVLGPRRRPGV